MALSHPELSPGAFRMMTLRQSRSHSTPRPYGQLYYPGQLQEGAVIAPAGLSVALDRAIEAPPPTQGTPAAINPPAQSWQRYLCKKAWRVGAQIMLATLFAVLADPILAALGKLVTMVFGAVLWLSGGLTLPLDYTSSLFLFT